MKKLCKSFSFIFLMMFCFFGFAEIGNAYCVHNDSSISLDVIGETCPRCYHGILHSGDSGCCPGADSGCRGTTLISVELCADVICESFNSPCKVTAHGDVYITGPNLYHLYAHVYDDNGNQICEGPIINPF
jgi:hypothetical protein